MTLTGERRKQWAKLYWQKNKERLKKQKKEWRKKNKDKIAAHGKEYRRKNKKKRQAYIRKYSKTEKGKSQAKKARIRYRLRYAANTGKIKKPNHCQLCKRKMVKRKIHGHHKDYSKPYDVIWACNNCHCKIHKEVNVQFGRS